jgi:aquaporin Z
MHTSSQLSGADLIRTSSLKLVFEAIGTFFLTLAFNCSQKLRDFSVNQTAVLLTLWVLTIFGQRISGAHYNPAISIAHMLRKDVGSFPRLLAVAYIVA